MANRLPSLFHLASSSSSQLPLPHDQNPTPNMPWSLMNNQEHQLLGPSSSAHRSEADGCSDQVGNPSGKTKKAKREKFAFQTRSKVDILDDGYRWRKYGQKSVKNQKFPRSYYRCTHEGCNVKKQVQRHSMDEGVVVTTYEGVHSHSIQKPADSFEAILNQLQIYNNQYF